MKCPSCNYFRTEVLNTEDATAGYRTRRRVCKNCCERYSTIELYIPETTTAYRLFKHIGSLDNHREALLGDIESGVKKILEEEEYK